MPKMLAPQVVSSAVAAVGARLLRSRRLMRAPIWLYRARLGFLFGTRMLMLEHIGRKSGARRYVVLEVLGHPGPTDYVVASGFGTRAQWYRNVQANPGVRVFVGSRPPADAVARLLTPAAGQAALEDYTARHPRAWGNFKPVIEATLGTPIDERGTELPMVGLRLEEGSIHRRATAASNSKEGSR